MNALLAILGLTALTAGVLYVASSGKRGPLDTDGQNRPAPPAPQGGPFVGYGPPPPYSRAEDFGMPPLLTPPILPNSLTGAAWDVAAEVNNRRPGEAQNRAADNSPGGTDIAQLGLGYAAANDELAARWAAAGNSGPPPLLMKSPPPPRPSPKLDALGIGDDAPAAGDADHSDAGPWDEQFYLSTNGDVAAAVSSGSISSGAWHYLNFGRAENRPHHGTPSAAQATPPQPIPSPPPPPPSESNYDPAGSLPDDGSGNDFNSLDRRQAFRSLE